jgi:hypothetical protein
MGIQIFCSLAKNSLYQCSLYRGETVFKLIIYCCFFFKYTAVQQSCRFRSATIGTTQANYVTHSSYGFAAGNEAWLQNRVATVGPISVAIFVNRNFQLYRSGMIICYF